MIQPPYDSLICRRTVRLLVPMVQIFAVYVLFFGQYGPGGGFVAGVMFAASVVVDLLVFGDREETRQAAERLLASDGVGLLIFAGIGGLCLIGGGAYLDYSGLVIPGLDEAERRHLAILLTQAGVGIDIAIASISIVFSLWRAGETGDEHA